MKRYTVSRIWYGEGILHKLYETNYLTLAKLLAWYYKTGGSQVQVFDTKQNEVIKRHDTEL